MRHNQPPCADASCPLLFCSPPLPCAAVCQPSYVQHSVRMHRPRMHTRTLGHSVQKYTQHHHVPQRRVENRERLAVFVVLAQNGAAIVHSTGWLASLRTTVYSENEPEYLRELREQFTAPLDTERRFPLRRRRTDDLSNHSEFCIFSLIRSIRLVVREFYFWENKGKNGKIRILS